MSISYLSELKTATATVHAEVEAIPVFNTLLSDTVSVKNYRDALYMLYQFHQSVEPAMFEHLPESFIVACGLRSRLDALRNDLHNLDTALPSSSDKLNTINDEASAFGACYVLEGSSLGGAVIRKHLLRHLHPVDPLPLRFYSFHLQDLSAYWKHFSTTFETAASLNKLSLDNMQTGAHAVFNHLLQLCSQEHDTEQQGMMRAHG